MTPTEETHPYNDREKIPGDTRLLIVGTAPPPRFSINSAGGEMRGLDFDFFYGSEDNYMWQFLEDIAQEVDNIRLFADDATSDDCIDASRRFLQSHRIWMHDVLQTYRRKLGKECSAKDADIEIEEFTSFKPLFESSPHLKAIAFTSEQATKWAFEALMKQKLITQEEYKAFEDSLAQWQNFKISPMSREDDIKRKFKRPFLTSTILKVVIDFYLLPSPTGRSRIGLKITDKKEIYKNIVAIANPS